MLESRIITEVENIDYSDLQLVPGHSECQSNWLQMPSIRSNNQDHREGFRTNHLMDILNYMHL